jgi:hypothetical protein
MCALWFPNVSNSVKYGVLVRRSPRILWVLKIVASSKRNLHSSCMDLMCFSFVWRSAKRMMEMVVVCTFVNISHALFGLLDWQDMAVSPLFCFLSCRVFVYLLKMVCDCFLLHHKSYWHWAIPVQLSRAIAPLQICIALGMLKTFGIIPS